MTGEDRARLDTQNVRRLGVWSDETTAPRSAVIAFLCFVALVAIAGMGLMVFGLV